MKKKLIITSKQEKIALSSSGLGYPALNRITLVRIQLVLYFFYFFFKTVVAMVYSQIHLKYQTQ